MTVILKNTVAEVDTPDDQDALREQVRAVLATAKLTQATAAREAGIAYTTFSAWLGGTYAGNNEKVAADVQRWLSSRAARAQTAANLPARPGFVATETAARIWPVLQYAQTSPDISVIVGAAGVGKTTALRQYQSVTSNVWVATMTPSTAGVSTMLAEICIEMGLDVRAASQFARAVERRVRGTGGLLVIDEAQHLTRPALEQLRSIHDRAEIGIVLAGNPAVLARLEGDRKTDFAQLFSRVGMRLRLAKPRAGDVAAMLDAWDVTDPEQVALCRAIAAKPGALRGMVKALGLAAMVAAGDGRSRTAEDIKTAWSQLDPQALVGPSA